MESDHRKPFGDVLSLLVETFFSYSSFVFPYGIAGISHAAPWLRRYLLYDG